MKLKKVFEENMETQRLWLLAWYGQVLVCLIAGDGVSTATVLV